MILRIIFSALALSALSAFASDEPATNIKKPFRDAATHDQLVLALRKSGHTDPMKLIPEASGPDPSKVNQPVNLLEQSDIICFGGMATLVPKRAILTAPEKFKQRLAIQPGARIVGWSEFFAANRGWIRTVEVSRVQAEGNKDLKPSVRERIEKSMYLVVATLMGGPISVLPLKEPAPSAETNTLMP